MITRVLTWDTLFMNNNKTHFKRNLIIILAVMVLTIGILITISFFLIQIKPEKGCLNCSENKSETVTKFESYLNKGYYELAEEKLKQAIKENPKNNILYLKFARMLELQKRYNEAIKYYEKYISLEKPNLEVLLSISSIYDKQKQYMKAKKHLETALTIAPMSEIANNNLCWILAEDKQYSKALPYCKKALKLSPGSSYIIDSMGYTLAGLNRLDEAIDYYNEAISIDPDISEYHRHLAEAYLLKKDNKKALEHFKKALETEPNGEYTNEIKQKIKSISNLPFLEKR